MTDTIRMIEARAALSAMGLSLRSADGEYRVAFAGTGNEASAYYTNDLWDAYSTGLSMSRERDMRRAGLGDPGLLVLGL